MNAKSLIFWEIPRNTLIWPKSAEIGVIDVKYIYFPYISGYDVGANQYLAKKLPSKSPLFWEMPKFGPSLAKISRNGGQQQ